MRKINGFSLVELLMVVVLIGVLGILISAILINQTGLFYSQSARVEQRASINNSLRAVQNNLRDSYSVATGYPEISPAYISSSSALVLKLASVSNQGVAFPNVYDYIVYTEQNGKFYEKVFPDDLSSRKKTEVILADNIDTILIEYYDITGSPVTPPSAEKVKMTLKLKQKAGAYFETNIATTEAQLKNKIAL